MMEDSDELLHLSSSFPQSARGWNLCVWDSQIQQKRIPRGYEKKKDTEEQVCYIMHLFTHIQYSNCIEHVHCAHNLQLLVKILILGEIS